jgi:cytochrome c
MKKILFLLIAFLMISCKKENEKVITNTQNPKSSIALGKELFENKGTCIACHLPEQKVVGPSITAIATIYKEKKGNLIKFLKGEAAPIVDPNQYEIMQANFAITKTMSDEELKALEAYMYSFLK